MPPLALAGAAAVALLLFLGRGGRHEPQLQSAEQRSTEPFGVRRQNSSVLAGGDSSGLPEAFDLMQARAPNVQTAQAPLSAGEMTVSTESTTAPSDTSGAVSPSFYDQYPSGGAASAVSVPGGGGGYVKPANLQAPVSQGGLIITPTHSGGGSPTKFE